MQYSISILAPQQFHLLNHPGYWKWLHVFILVLVDEAAAADFDSHDKFWSTFQIFLIFGRIDNCDLLITWSDFGWFLFWPWSWIFKVKYLICCISGKLMTWLLWNEKWTYWLTTRPQIWASISIPWPFRPKGYCPFVQFETTINSIIFTELWLIEKWYRTWYDVELGIEELISRTICINLIMRHGS